MMNLNKGFSWLILILIILIVVGGYFYFSPKSNFNLLPGQTNSANSSYSNTNSTAIPTSTTPTAADSGISGMVTIGPSCPGPTRQGTDCADKPYPTTLSLFTKAGVFIRNIQVGQDGKFTTTIAPGEYQIRQSGTAHFPRAGAQNVLVKPHQFTHVDIQFDSGLR